jgi:hypothetical protein
VGRGGEEEEIVSYASVLHGLHHPARALAKRFENVARVGARWTRCV